MELSKDLGAAATLQPVHSLCLSERVLSPVTIHSNKSCHYHLISYMNVPVTIFLQCPRTLKESLVFFFW